MIIVKKLVKLATLTLSALILVLGPTATVSARVSSTVTKARALVGPANVRGIGDSFKSGDFSLDKEGPSFDSPAKDLFDPGSRIPKYSTDQVIVKFKQSGLSIRSSIARKYNSTLIERIDDTRSFTAEVPTGATADELAEQMSKDPAVEYAEPDFKRAALGQKTSWGFDAINAGDAHATNLVTGSGVIIAIVDTGVDYQHDDLDANIWTNLGETAGNGLDDDGNGFVDDVRGWDFAGSSVSDSGDEDNNPNDTYAHGTHVAGIAAAEDNAIGTVGVAPDATIMPVKVFDDLYGYALDSTIADGIYYAVDNGADIINLSLGGPVPSRLMSDAMDYAAASNVAVAVAAGNEYGFNAFTSYPAAYASSISVGALDESGNKTWWSNWGKVDVMAPGDEIISSVVDDRYAEYSGTSMAAPFVAGELALIKEANPGFDAGKLKQVLMTSSSDMYRSNQDYLTGTGTIDALSASGALSDSVNLTASAFRIIADNNDFTDGISTISARVLEADGDPVVGELVSFTTDKGDLSAPSDLTDADGIAAVDLTADNESGLANVTATAGVYGSANIQVVLFNDKVNIFNLKVNAGGSECDEFDCYYEELSSTKIMAGDKVSFSIILRDIGLIYLDTYGGRTADFSYQVLDSLSAPVSGLSGTVENKDVGIMNQFNVNKTLPFDMDDGKYRFEVTVTDSESGKTETMSTPFTVGDVGSEILVIPSESYNFFTDPYLLDSIIGTEETPTSTITSALDSIGASYDVWPNAYFPSDVSEIAGYPMVIFAGSSQYNTSLIKDYLNSGGNAYVSGNSDWISAVNGDNYGGYVGWCAGTPIGYESAELYFSCPSQGTEYQPTDNGDVSGIASTIFDGMTFNIDPFNLNGDGAKNQFYTDIFDVAVDATPILEYSGGEHGGLSIDTGSYRLVLTGIGLEGIHDNVGGNTRADLLSAVYNFLKPASVSVASVSPTSVDKGTARTITVSGDGFETTGKTTVTLDGVELDDVTVIDRATLTAIIPASYPAVGLEDLTVTNPFGQSDTLVDAIRVRHPAPIVSSVSPKFGSNDKVRKITITGKNFRAGAVVKLDSKTLTNVDVLSSKKITADVKAGTTVDLYTITVKNTDGRYDTLSNSYRVRFGFTYDLIIGMTDPAVLVLEKRLKAEGFFDASVATNDYFGTATRTAVFKYQKAHGLSQTGILNSQTRSYLNNH